MSVRMGMRPTQGLNGWPVSTVWLCRVKGRPERHKAQPRKRGRGEATDLQRIPRERSFYGLLNIIWQSGEMPELEGHPMTETKRPDFAAYVVRDRDDKKSNWREIGVAFTHKDGKGFDLLLLRSSLVSEH